MASKHYLHLAWKLLDPNQIMERSQSIIWYQKLVKTIQSDSMTPYEIKDIEEILYLVIWYKLYGDHMT